MLPEIQIEKKKKKTGKNVCSATPFPRWQVVKIEAVVRLVA